MFFYRIYVILFLQFLKKFVLGVFGFGRTAPLTFLGCFLLLMSFNNIYNTLAQKFLEYKTFW